MYIYKTVGFNYLKITNIYKNNPKKIEKLCLKDCLTLKESYKKSQEFMIKT